LAQIKTILVEEFGEPEVLRTRTPSALRQSRGRP
jgi:hypothetical protein